MAEPTKALVFSAADEELVLTFAAAAALGKPVVIDHDGEPHEVRTSPYIPAGQAYAVDLALLDLPTPAGSRPHS